MVTKHNLPNPENDSQGQALAGHPEETAADATVVPEEVPTRPGSQRREAKREPAPAEETQPQMVRSIEAQPTGFVHLSASEEERKQGSRRPRRKRPARRPAPTLSQTLGGLVNQVLGLGRRVEEEFEGVEERLLSGQSGGRKIKTVHLARGLENELERSLHHLMKEIIAPNRFIINLSPPDYEQYRPFKERSEQDLTEHLCGVVEARDYQVLGPVRVDIVLSPNVRPGAYPIQAQIEKDTAPAASGPYLELVPEGQRFPLEGEEVITIGRSQQNDICLGDIDRRRVISRQHAHIRREEDGFVLYDGLNGRPSTGGTHVEGHRLNGTGHTLQDSQSIILGPTQRLDPTRPLQGSLMFIFHLS